MRRARPAAQLPGSPTVHLDAARILLLEDRSLTGLPRFLSAPSVARLLDCSTAWIRLWAKAGLLPSYTLHAVAGDRGRLLFREADVRAFLAARGLPVDDAGKGAR